MIDIGVLSNFLIAGGGLLCWLSSALLLTFNKSKKLDKKILALLLTLLGAIAFIDLGMNGMKNTAYPIAFHAGGLIAYLIPPALLLYAQLLLGQRVQVAVWVYFLHAVPFFLALIDLSFFYLLQDLERLAWVAAVLKKKHMHFMLATQDAFPFSMRNIPRLLQGYSYVFWIAAVLYRSIKNKKFGTLTKPEQQWMVVLYTMFLMYYVGLTWLSLTELDIHLTFLGHIPALAMLAFSLFFFILSIKPFFMPRMVYSIEGFMEENQLQPEKESTLSEKLSLVNQTREMLTEEKVQHYAQLLDRRMNEEQLFRQVHRLDELANCLDISARYLSYVLSKYYQLSFNDYLNGFRINYVLEQIKNGRIQKYTLESVAREAGFISRSTFSKAFKKQTGVTPTAYLKSVK